MNAQPCKFGSGFFRRGCSRRAVSDCVYCGRPFCAEHGKRGENYTDVCAGKRCREKLQDLRTHSQWRERASASNRVSVCAIENCAERQRHQCSRCRLLFCRDHVSNREIRDHSVQPAATVLALVCAHCRERRRIWD